MKTDLGRALQALLGFWRRHRRLIVILIAVSLFFSALGYFARPVAMPGMCKIYG
ncbi:hypothetical protein [Thauera propionica]|uniref:hypothetical protein n=1 Tax=Thauera propionica TaxID=2019431 RepID=UPI0023F553FC|nr:hypothetical protein [Thauera propionica]MDD3675463.1 hypothetical protein [Thauera propionica]